ncbi:4-hydroxy-3-methylbut-2-enyl diphosphate reductase [Clostridium sp. YIM B02515]|uniref:4-hydroxy-3-methylbut-2-enyl diphosphate reductase n=1 Tax=Clostridium rhizosphaerae TaxID=2803861 RepID=A0ABS1T7K3_9CLOT|nr:4-hydroxy-3-methylbut-2-enyl diphosphate reductase [Clostridium rhizosphaerae]MBL4935319.1 4-hydroxy-3-methylbut-2-enyl diphosphate reductase [Clostridium rhizosphaerae]
MIKEVIMAENAGFCFGVKRAVDTSIDSNKDSNTNIYTFGPLVHNKNVTNNLKEKGINEIILSELNKLSSCDTVIIRSHGVTPKVMELIKSTGARVIDATCPYVSAIHKKIKKYYDLGYQIIIIGDENHPEVIGSNGWCDDSAIITKDGCNLNNLSQKVCIVVQTTEKKENFDKVVDIVSNKCSDVVTFNTICSATKERQASAEETSKKVDVMLVVGSKDSSNTTKLYEICCKNCNKTIFVESSSDIPEWIFRNEYINRIGVTAGASTPDWIIEQVLDKINNKSNI